MALCEKCEFYNRNYANMRKNYDDCIVIVEDKREKDFCIMYDDFIPLNITYEDADCPFFLQKEDAKEGANERS